MRPDVPVFGMVSRLVSQKGLELIGSVLDDILALDVQLVVLGSGEKHYEDMFRSASRRYPDKVLSTLCLAIP